MNEMLHIKPKKEMFGLVPDESRSMHFYINEIWYSVYMK